MQFLDRLRDESRWVIRRGKPIFTPHKRTGPDGAEIVVTEADLAEIARNANRLFKKSGVAGRLTPGHLQPKAAETDQPPIWGYTLNYRVSRFGPERKPCVVYDEYVYPQHAKESALYPYRSAEYYPAAKEIRGVALLKRDPFLDMGMTAYAGALNYGRGHDQPFYYYAEPMPMDEREKPVGEGAEQEQPPPEGHDQWKGHMEHFSKSDPTMKYMKACYDAQGGVDGEASATNAIPGEKIPGEKKPGEKDYSKLGGGANKAMWAQVDDAGEDKRGTGKDGKKAGYTDMNGEWHTSMQRDEAPINYARLQAEHASLRKQVAEITAERDREQCQRMVKQLQLEGYQLNGPKEAATLYAKTPELRAEYVATIRRFATPMPVGDMIQVYQGDVEGVTKTASLSDAQAAQCVAYSKGDEARYDEAVAKVKRGEKLSA